ncbi:MULTISPECIES: ribokinase [unclassified Sedimentibacter]|uniref:ribokinase n=1 Tax=unclassified Sedimentibacter TaxID=2649220 RepID=UPI0027E17ACD|nr:ribokinase [Sedimentibacter sp. MB35-C1]WMJ77158.1 ribokinase [Sedimentibacter sp. MB35-C1]
MGKVVVVGSINVDMVFTSDIRPKAGETVLGNTFSLIPGGKGANQAVAASKLCADSFMVGCVGADTNGSFAVDNLKSANVNTDCIQAVNDIPTGVANIIVAEGDNSIIVIPGANYKVDREIINKYKDVILSADIVLLQLEIPLEAVEYTLDICTKNNVKVLLNPAPAVELSSSMIENASYITPNEHELKIIMGKNTDVEEEIKRYPNKLIVTLGSKGVKYYDGSEMKLIPSNKVDVVDTTGAGDTFCGALAAALVNGSDLEEAIIFANKAAAYSITKLGAQSGMPTLEQLESGNIVK